jgi:PAS domain S-box-containing protein
MATAARTRPAARSRASKGASTMAGLTGTPATNSAESLAHELRVHQIELESQNEELRQTQLDLAAARDRFIDLYDFAPVGYFTLDPAGRFVEANLAAAALLGVQRQSLLGRPLLRFIVAADTARWRQHLQVALQCSDSQRIELGIQPVEAPPIHAQLDCMRVLANGAHPVIRVALTNVTQRVLAEMDRRIAADVVKARETERQRVARELHEDLGQRLSALKMNLASLQSARGTVTEQVAPLLEALDDAVATVRRISSELRPMMLDDLGLNAAMEWLACDAGRRLGMTVALQLDEVESALDESTTVAMYRILQEALAHVSRYAGAREVAISMKRSGAELQLNLQHDGSGWPLRQAAHDDDSARALREHARLMGGRLVVHRLPGGGQRITLGLPLPGSGISSRTPTHRDPPDFR